MLTIQEQQYFKSLIDTYKKEGYDYYVLATDRPGTLNYQYEFVVYFSKTIIIANSRGEFEITNGIKINIDSTLRNVNTNNDLIYNQEQYSGTLIIPGAEFIYTNAVTTYLATTSMYSPDLFLGEGVNYTHEIYIQGFIFTFICAIIIAFLFKLFR
jgi:hypothetical protein